MNAFQALLLGIVEGITEYLPVSSTGHLILVQRVLGIEATESANSFAICIQSGAIVAVLGFYSSRFRQMLDGLAGRNKKGRQLCFYLLISLIPSILVGVTLNDLIKHYLFDLWTITLAWFVGGLFILAIPHIRSRSPSAEKNYSLNQLTWKMALLIGLVQCLAMWPGLSRSMVTISCGVIFGLHLMAAVEYSFLLGMLTLTGATVYEMASSGFAIANDYSWLYLTVGFFSATFSAWITINWLIRYLNQHSLAIFGYYRIVLAMVVACWLLSILSGS